MQLFFSAAMLSLIASPTVWLIGPAPGLAQAPAPAAGAVRLPSAALPPLTAPVSAGQRVSIDTIHLPENPGEYGSPSQPHPRLPQLQPASLPSQASPQAPLQAGQAGQARPAVPAPFLPAQALPRRLLIMGLEPILPLPEPGAGLSHRQGPLPQAEELGSVAVEWSAKSSPSSPVAGLAVPAAPPLSLADPYPSFGSAPFDQQLRRYLTYLETLGRPDILIVGSDRARQAINPLVLQASLGDRGYDNLRIFNWGIDNANAQTVELLLREVLSPHQRPRLLLWADGAAALNGGPSDLGFEGLLNSPGYRRLQQGQAPYLSLAEHHHLQSQRQLLTDLQTDSIALALPEGLKRFSPWAKQTGFQSGPAQPPLPAAPRPPRASAPATSSWAAAATRPQPILSAQQSAIRLPRLQPLLEPSPGSPAALPPSPPAQSQPTAPRLRLVHWCRSLKAPCQPDGEGLRSVVPGQPTPEPAQLPPPPRPAGHSASSRTTPAAPQPAPQPAPDLPPWQPSDRQRRYLNALGFQADHRHFAPEPARTGQQPGQGKPEDDRYHNFSLQGSQNQAFYRTLQWGQAEDIPIAFLPLPVSQAYLETGRDRHQRAFQLYLDVADQMTPLHLIRLKQGGHSIPWGNEHFADASHFNSSGAAVLSWQLGQSLDPALLKPLRN